VEQTPARTLTCRDHRDGRDVARLLTKDAEQAIQRRDSHSSETVGPDLDLHSLSDPDRVAPYRAASG
jgi:hypothetical protein